MIELASTISDKPLVTVVCISFNHAPYIPEALNSVFNQTYSNLEIIVLDDCSKDESQKVIVEVISDHPDVQYYPHQSNQGYPKTFNEGLKLAKGEFIIDFALDDVMLPDFIEKSIERLQSLDTSFGVSFSNADYINHESAVIDNHNALLRKKGLIDKIPEGDIFEMVMKRYFICTPTMVIRKVVFDRMGSYDEELDYEDFDFWVRSARQFKYAYIDEVLVQKRKLNNSMSANRYQHRENGQMLSVLKVCQKAFSLCKTKSELAALRQRLYYEHRQCVRHQAYEISDQHLSLIRSVGGKVYRTKLVAFLIKLGFDNSSK